MPGTEELLIKSYLLRNQYFNSEFIELISKFKYPICLIIFSISSFLNNTYKALAFWLTYLSPEI